jgi:hypothetical protein
MRSFAPNTILRDQIEVDDGMNLWPKLLAEVNESAPTVLQVLVAIAGSNQQSIDRGIDCGIHVALCILSMVRSQRCNRFQKIVAIMLSNSS